LDKPLSSRIPEVYLTNSRAAPLRKIANINNNDLIFALSGCTVASIGKNEEQGMAIEPPFLLQNRTAADY
jgi:hypothetical protein